MDLIAEIISAGKTSRTFKKQDKQTTVDIFLIVARCLHYGDDYDLIIYDQEIWPKAQKEIVKGVEGVFRFRTLKGNAFGDFNRYATLDKWKITKTLEQKIKEMIRQANGSINITLKE